MTDLRALPLDGIWALNLNRILAGSWAGQKLTSLGAEIIKVKRPGEGDDTRRRGPPFLGWDGDAGYFLAVNRGKRSITLDTASAEGPAVVRQLAARSDVVVENFRVGTLDRFGLGAEALRALNPGWCTAPSPDTARPGRAGLRLHDPGELRADVRDQRSGWPAGDGPQKVGIPMINLMTGMLGLNLQAGWTG